jgi:hypothetical protein
VVKQHCAQVSGLYAPETWVPHVTVAMGNLTPETSALAKENLAEYRPQPSETLHKLWLARLRDETGRWELVAEYPLAQVDTAAADVVAGMPDDLHPGLRDYLYMAYNFYIEDRLDMAMQVADDAFKHVGWPGGTWDEFYNHLTCEKDARDSATLHRIDDGLSIELDRDAPFDLYQHLASTASEARSEIANMFQVKFERPIMITVFRPDSPLEYISGRHGYASFRTELDKVCIPRNAAESDRVVETFLH